MNDKSDEATNGWFAGHEAADLFLKISSQLRAESDRGTVIVAAAIIDEALEQLLKARLAPSNGRDDELFDSPYAPLSSFSAKIDFAYRVGVVAAEVKATFHLLRKLRNEFAHSSGNLDFGSQLVQSRIREVYKLNVVILEGWFESLRDRLQYANEGGIGAALNKAAAKHSSIEGMLELLGWRGLFDLFMAMHCAALIRVQSQVETIPELNGETGAGLNYEAQESPNLRLRSERAPRGS